MNIVVDTSILIDYLRGHLGARGVVSGALGSGRTLFACVVTRIEVLAGMLPSEALPTHALMALLVWIPVDESIADRAGALASQYRRSHPGVDPVDFAIAATTESLDAELWTRNVRHFPMLTAVRTPYTP